MNFCLLRIISGKVRGKKFAVKTREREQEVTVQLLLDARAEDVFGTAAVEPTQRSSTLHLAFVRSCVRTRH